MAFEKFYCRAASAKSNVTHSSARRKTKGIFNHDAFGCAGALRESRLSMFRLKSLLLVSLTDISDLLPPYASPWIWSGIAAVCRPSTMKPGQSCRSPSCISE
jgi:hypothetical protein